MLVTDERRLRAHRTAMHATSTQIHAAHSAPGASLGSLALAVSLASLPVATGLVAGCGSRAGGPADERRLVAALTAARDTVCACRDLACADAAEQQLADFLLRHVDSLKKIPAPRPNTAALGSADALRIDGELRVCKRRLEEADRA